MLLSAWYLLLTNSLTTRGRWQALLDVVIGAGIVTMVVFILRAIFHVDLTAVVFGRSVVNTLEDVNGTFGIWVVVLVVLTLGQLLHKKVPAEKQIFYFVGALTATITLVLLSFQAIWIALSAALFLLLLLGVCFIQEVSLGWLTGVFALFIFTFVFIVFDTPRSFQSVLPLEAS